MIENIEVRTRTLEDGVSLSAGEGVAIDRPIMLFTDQSFICNVVRITRLWPEK